MHVTALALASLLTLQPAAVPVDGNGRWGGIERDTRGATRASVEFVIPAVTDQCGTGATSNAAVWVGLGNSLPFTQLGVTLAPESRGAWYELFDAAGRGPVVDVPLTINVGDRMRLRLAFTPDHTTLLFVWRDLTTGKAQRRTIDRAQRYWSGNAVEWIVERSRQTLANFGHLTFDRAHYTAGGKTHNLTPASYEAVIYRGGKRATRTTVNSPTSATVHWLRCGG